MSDDDEDPLGVGKVIEEIDIKPTPEPRKRINSQSPRDLHKLIDIDLYSLSHVKIKSLKKRKSTMLQPSDSLFGPEDEEKIKATASLPYFSVDIPQITVKKNESTSKFEVFLDEEKGNYKYGNVTPAICSTRKQLFDQSIDRVRKAIQNCKLSLDTSVLRKAEYEQAYRMEAETSPFELCCSFLGDLDNREQEILRDVINTVQEVKE